MMPSPRYDLAVQRHAAEQVFHHRPVAQVARQLQCSPQSVKIGSTDIAIHRSSDLFHDRRRFFEIDLGVNLGRFGGGVAENGLGIFEAVLVPDLRTRAVP